MYSMNSPVPSWAASSETPKVASPGFHFIAGLAPLEVHHRAMSAAGELCRAGKALACWLVEIDDRRLYQQFSCSSVYHYGARYLGLAGHTVAEYLRTARKLSSLPALSAAYEKGELSSALVREITRVATPQTDCSWRDAARGRTAREIEKMVAFTPKGAFPGNGAITEEKPKARAAGVVTEESLPDAPPSTIPLPVSQPSRYIEKLVLEMAAEDMALLQAAFHKARRETGKSDRATLMLHIAGAFLEGATRGIEKAEDRRTPYRVVLHHHLPSGLTWCRTLKGERPVTSQVLDRILCDAEVMEGETPTGEDCTGGDPTAHTRINQLYQHLKRLKTRKKQQAPTVPGSTAAMPEPGKDCSEDRSVQRLAQDRTVAMRPRRTLSPSLRKKVLERDGWRCKAPGCEQEHFLAIHHLDPVALGGRDNEKRLITLCQGCHDLVHQGLLDLAGD